MENEIRLDVYLNEKESIGRERAKDLIKEEKITVNNKIITKPSYKVSGTDLIKISEGEEYKKYVSRGGYKLEKAINVFNINFTDKKVLDVGASTGGFTDCILMNGGRYVCSVDVGQEQLHESLKNDKRVNSIENTNILDLTPEEIGNDFDYITMDVSFVSITKIVSHLSKFLKLGGNGIFLIKPQFEAGKEFLNKNGVVKNPKVHKNVISKIETSLRTAKYAILDICESPIKGRSGNIEYLIYVEKR